MREAPDFYLVRHTDLDTAVFEAGLGVAYKALVITDTHIAVECRITLENGQVVTRVGEVTEETKYSETAHQYPTTVAYQRAHDRAAIAALQFMLDSGDTYTKPGKPIYSEVEIKPETIKKRKKAAQGKKPETAAIFPDNEVFLFGRFKGKTFGEAKAAKDDFDAFVKHIRARADVTYQDPEVSDQMNRLRKYLEETTG